MKTILLIEDDQFIRDLYKRQLQLAGFEVSDVGTGKEGLTSIQQKHYDLVLLDIMLPDINGLQLLKTVKNDPNLKQQMITLLTNLGHEPVIQEGLRLGASGYLIKSNLSPDQIVEQVKSMISQ